MFVWQVSVVWVSENRIRFKRVFWFATALRYCAALLQFENQPCLKLVLWGCCMNGQVTIIMAAIIHMLYVRFPCSLFPHTLLKFVPFFPGVLIGWNWIYLGKFQCVVGKGRVHMFSINLPSQGLVCFSWILSFILFKMSGLWFAMILIHTVDTGLFSGFFFCFSFPFVVLLCVL